MADAYQIPRQIQRQQPAISQYLTSTEYAGGEPGSYWDITAMSPQLLAELALLESGSPASMMLPTMSSPVSGRGFSPSFQSFQESPWGSTGGPHPEALIPMGYFMPQRPENLGGKELQKWLSTALQGPNSLVPWLATTEKGTLNPASTLENLYGFRKFLGSAKPEGIQEDALMRAVKAFSTMGGVNVEDYRLSPGDAALVADIYRKYYLPTILDDQSLQRVLGGQ